MKFCFQMDLGALAKPLGPLWSVGGAAQALLVVLWDLFGATVGFFGVFKSVMGTSLGPAGARLRSFGAPLVSLWPVGGALAKSLWAHFQVFVILKTVQKTLEITLPNGFEGTT